MEFRQLRYFLAVAEELHFTLAAEKLGIAQPPLSQQIMKLEREIGTPLFIRYARRVELTEAGQQLRESAQRILQETEDALTQAKLAARGKTGNISVGFAGSIVFHPLVAKAMRQFREKYPVVLIKSEESNSTELLNRVSEGKIDCAFVRLPLNCQELQVAELVSENMVAVLPSEHPLSRRSNVELAQLSTDSLVLFPRNIGPQLYDSILSAFHKAGFSPLIGMESPQISSAINMVAAGFGVTIVPYSIRQINTLGVTYHPIINPELITSIALIFRLREKSVTVKNFVKIINDTAKLHESVK